MLSTRAGDTKFSSDRKSPRKGDHTRVAVLGRGGTLAGMAPASAWCRPLPATSSKQRLLSTDVVRHAGGGVR